MTKINCGIITILQHNTIVMMQTRGKPADPQIYLEAFRTLCWKPIWSCWLSSQGQQSQNWLDRQLKTAFGEVQSLKLAKTTS